MPRNFFCFNILIFIYFFKYETISTFAPTFWTHIIFELDGVKGFVSYLKYLTNSSPIFVKKYIVPFKIINKTKTELLFRQKIDLKLGGHYTCQMIEIVYKGFIIIKKTKWARQQLHSIVFVCRKGWSKYWFCLYIVVFWTRSLRYYLAAFTSIYLM